VVGPDPEHLLAEICSWENDKPAVIRLTGNPEPELFADLDPARVAGLAPKDKAAVAFPLLSADVVAWTVVAATNKSWAHAIFGAPDLDRLWDAVAQADGARLKFR
jgi:aminopeptidase